MVTLLKQNNLEQPFNFNLVLALVLIHKSQVEFIPKILFMLEIHSTTHHQFWIILPIIMEPMFGSIVWMMNVWYVKLQAAQIVVEIKPNVLFVTQVYFSSYIQSAHLMIFWMKMLQNHVDVRYLHLDFSILPMRLSHVNYATQHASLVMVASVKMIAPHVIP